MYNGANDIEMLQLNQYIRKRIEYVHFINSKGSIIRTKNLKSAPPHNLTVLKGYVYGTFSHGFVKHTLRKKYAKDLLEWLKDVFSPDEL